MFCSVSIPLFFSLILLNLEGNVWDKRGDKVLNREVNHKLSRGTQFQGDLVSAIGILEETHQNLRVQKSLK